jgi:hypothetical protein
MLHELEKFSIAWVRGETLQVTGHADQHVLQRHVPKHVFRYPFSQARMGEVRVLEMLFTSWSKLIGIRCKV